MSATSALSPGNTAATTPDIVVPAGSVAMVGIYSDVPGSLPPAVRMEITLVTPGQPINVGRLKQGEQATTLSGPGTYRITRSAYEGTAFGVFVDLG